MIFKFNGFVKISFVIEYEQVIQHRKCISPVYLHCISVGLVDDVIGYGYIVSFSDVECPCWGLVEGASVNKNGSLLDS